MAETKQLLERAGRAFDPPAEVMDALVIRRDRKRRNQRVQAGLVGLAIAIGLGWQLGVIAFGSTPLPADEPPPTPGIMMPTPAAPPVASDLAFGVDGDVFLADADGSNVVKIADGVPDAHARCAPGEEEAQYVAFGTAWSPDGRYLAYWNWRPCAGSSEEWGTVITTDAEGNVVTSFPGEAWQISWSPDSTRIAVMDVWAGGGGDATVGIYGLDGARQAALTVPDELVPTGDYSPVWSRDGSSILLPGAQVPLDGGAPAPLPAGAPVAWFGAYSPDGSLLATVDRRSLVVQAADGVPDAYKPSTAWEFWDVAWSPNGELVAWNANDRSLFVRDVATGADTSLVDARENERLSVVEFSSDGDRILFTRSDAQDGQSLWSIGVDGSDLRRLVADIEWADLRPRI